MNKRYEMMKEISKAAASARSILHKKLRQQRTFAAQGQRHKHRPPSVNKREHDRMPGDQNAITSRRETSTLIESANSSSTTTRQPVLGSIFIEPSIMFIWLFPVILDYNHLLFPIWR